MNISLNGVNLIKGFEGYSGTPYQDVVGVWTWGYGHARKHGEDLPESITREGAEELLLKDLEPACKCVNTCVSVPINQNQFDALASFVYNIGCSSFTASTLLKKINASEMDGAENEFLRWNKAGGKVIDGLTRRRQAEAKLFSTPINTEAT